MSSMKQSHLYNIHSTPKDFLSLDSLHHYSSGAEIPLLRRLCSFCFFLRKTTR